MKNLTKRQREVLDYIEKHIVEDQRPPTMHEIKDYFNWASVNAAQCHLDSLKAKGWLEDGSRIKLKGVSVNIIRF